MLLLLLQLLAMAASVFFIAVAVATVNSSALVTLGEKGAKNGAAKRNLFESAALKRQNCKAQHGAATITEHHSLQATSDITHVAAALR